jgi:HSP20 family molecular chaperone IbpA
MQHAIDIYPQTSSVTCTHGKSDNALPYMTFEDEDRYSIVLNLLGCNPKDIFIDVDKLNNEVGIYAGKDGMLARSVSFWVFHVPTDGQIEKVAMKFKGGGLEVDIPRARMVKPLRTYSRYEFAGSVVA